MNEETFASTRAAAEVINNAWRAIARQIARNAVGEMFVNQRPGRRFDSRRFRRAVRWLEKPADRVKCAGRRAKYSR